MKRPDRSKEIDAFLLQAGWGNATRTLLAGDASFRRYERVHHGDRHAVLMDAPPPWEDVKPFLAISKTLMQCTVTVPQIFSADETQGLLLLEDLGDTIFTRVLMHEPGNELRLYRTAVDALVAMAQASHTHPDWATTILPYDAAVYLREVGLLAEWFLPQIVDLPKAQALRHEWLALWRDILAQTPLKRTVLVHRDYHADNLLWLADRPGHQAVGMLDYQDALWGDPAYDLVSLLEDARRDVAVATVEECLAYARDQLKESPDFMHRYAMLGAQRNAKIIGIFTRLCVRDGKPQYLEYLPRVWKHFLSNLSHPPLAGIRTFINTHVPDMYRGCFTANLTIGGITP